MNKVPTSTDEKRLLRLIASANASGDPIAQRSKDGRYIAGMDQDCVRDLRGTQFEREVEEAFDRATGTRLRATAEDQTCVYESDAVGMLAYVAVARLVMQLGHDQAAEALLRIGKDLRRYGACNLREAVLNLVDDAVHNLY